MIEELREAAGMAGLPLAVVTFARHPRQLFNDACDPFLLTSEAEKLQLLESMGVERLFLLNFDSGMASMSAERFMHDILADRLGVRLLGVGYDHRFGKPCEGECFESYVRYGKSAGIDVVRLSPFVVDGYTVSSTLVRRAVAAGDVQQARALLGYPYLICGTVVGGAGIGRGLGFPTANVQPDEALKLLPGDGVYEVAAMLDGNSYKGVMNIGVKPTVSDASLRTVEVHLLGFMGDIYGREIVVEPLRRLRGEMKFAGVEALRQQIAIDIAMVEQEK